MSCVLCTMSMMELETRKMLSAHTQNLERLPFRSPGHRRSPSSPQQGQFLNQHRHHLVPARRSPWPPLSHTHIQIERRTFSESHARPCTEFQVLPHSCRRRDGCCTSFQKHISQHLSADRVKCTRHIHRDNKQLLTPLVCFPQTFHQKRDNVQTLHAWPEPHQLTRKRSELFIQNLPHPHAHFIHFVQCRNQGNRGASWTTLKCRLSSEPSKYQTPPSI